MVTEVHERIAPVLSGRTKSAAAGADTAKVRRRPRWLPSPLTIRILALNVPALGILLGGALFLGQYRDGLVETKIGSLMAEGTIIAAALGESATPPETLQFDRDVARQLVARLASVGPSRARLFDANGFLIADSQGTGPAALAVRAQRLPAPGSEAVPQRVWRTMLNWVLRAAPNQPLPLYRENPVQLATDYPEVGVAIAGENETALRRLSDGTMLISVALPVQRFKRVLGALMLSVEADDIEEKVRDVRIAILQVFGLALAVTVLLSIYLSSTIARPIRRLAAAAHRTRIRSGRRTPIPDFTARRDEIGDLSGALRDMTDALYGRMDAIEAFAADVAHEIKNPLSSIRSAVEILPKTQDPERAQKLLSIIVADVRRLDRLITDISEASRVGAELARSEMNVVDLVLLVRTLVETQRVTKAATGMNFVVDADEPVPVRCVESRVGQVMRNLLANAVSFSPPGGTIRVVVRKGAGKAEVAVEDDGPGMPPDKLTAVFERFYSLRPENEPFGMHSGLGLSISKQIVEAHGGTIAAQNRLAGDGRVRGARFVFTLPLD